MHQWWIGTPKSAKLTKINIRKRLLAKFALVQWDQVVFELVQNFASAGVGTFEYFLILIPPGPDLKKINPDHDFFKNFNPDPESYFRASRVLTQGYFCASRAFLLIFVNFVLFGAPIHHWCTKMVHHVGVAPLRNFPLRKSPTLQLPTS